MGIPGSLGLHKMPFLYEFGVLAWYCGHSLVGLARATRLTTVPCKYTKFIIFNTREADLVTGVEAATEATEALKAEATLMQALVETMIPVYYYLGFSPPIYTIVRCGQLSQFICLAVQINCDICWTNKQPPYLFTSCDL